MVVVTVTVVAVVTMVESDGGRGSEGSMVVAGLVEIIVVGGIASVGCARVDYFGGGIRLIIVGVGWGMEGGCRWS